MREFKFFNNHIAIAHDGGYIYAGEYFYMMNMEELVVPKYTIVSWKIDSENKSQFKPDYDMFRYFNSLHNAEYLRNIWIRQDNQTN